MFSGLGSLNVAAFKAWCGNQRKLQSIDIVGTEKGAALTAIANPNAQVTITDYDPREFSLEGAVCEFGTIELAETRGFEVELKGLRIRNLIVDSRHALKLTGCYIGNFVIRNAFVDLTVEDSFINELSLQGRGSAELGRFVWRSGYLGHLASVLKGNFFQGEVSIRRLILPRHETGRGIQWLRNIRALLLEVHNARAANFFHAAELAQERANEPLVNRIASFAYEYGSDFGNSIGRPLAWVTASLVIITAIALCTGTDSGDGPLIGWRRILAGSGNEAELVRAFVYAFQSVFNPLNLFDAKSLVSVKSWPLAFVCSVVGMLGTTALALFVLSLRRRFKLE